MVVDMAAPLRARARPRIARGCPYRIVNRLPFPADLNAIVWRNKDSPRCVVRTWAVQAP